MPGTSHLRKTKSLVPLRSFQEPAMLVTRTPVDPAPAWRRSTVLTYGACSAEVEARQGSCAKTTRPLG